MTMGSSGAGFVFFGTEDFSAAILSRLIEAGFDIKAAATKPDTKRGRGKTLSPPAVKIIAGERGIPVLQPDKLTGATDELAAFGCRYAILAAYGKLIPKPVLDIFPDGIVNVHPSLLPRYRGASPIESAIVNGDQKTGVSLIRLVEKMDAGPLYVQREYALDGTETRPQLYGALTQIGADMLIEHLPAIVSGELQSKPQDDEHVNYCSLITKAHSVIDWQKPAAQIERDIRAYLGWPGSRTQLFGQDVTILEAEIADTAITPGDIVTSNEKILVGTAEKSLEIKKLRPAGRSSMDVSAFLRGLRAA